jgi:hypothetical protein
MLKKILAEEKYNYLMPYFLREKKLGLTIIDEYFSLIHKEYGVSILSCQFTHKE